MPRLKRSEADRHLMEAAGPDFLEALARGLRVIEGDDIMMIAHASSRRIIPVSGQIGFRLPAVATALGRVLLATLDDRGLDEFLARAAPQRLTKFTIVDRRALRSAILKV